MQLKAENAGRLISGGHGRHSTRIITSWELIFVLKSTLSMFVGKDDFAVSDGQCLLLPPGIRHGGRNDYPQELSFFWIHFRYEGKEQEKLLKRIPRCFSVANVNRLSEYFQCFLSLQEEEPDDREGLDILMNLIFHEATRKAKAQDTPAKLPPLVDQLRKILTLRFREPLSTSGLAAELKCNPDYLGRLWNQYYHEPITKTLNGIRIRHAAKLLCNSRLSIAEIGYEVGFRDLSYFRQCFFRVYAMLPGNYRKLQTREHVNTE